MDIRRQPVPARRNRFHRSEAEIFVYEVARMALGIAAICLGILCLGLWGGSP